MEEMRQLALELLEKWNAAERFNIEHRSVSQEEDFAAQEKEVVRYSNRIWSL